MDNGTSNLIINSYIEGDVDYIFGSSDTVFKDCIINTKSLHDFAFFLAPNTYCQNIHGFIFKDCIFKSNDIKTILARRWYPSGAISPVLPRITIMDSKYIGNIDLDIITMHENDPTLDITNIINATWNDKIIPNKGIDEYKYVEYILNKYKNYV